MNRERNIIKIDDHGNITMPTDMLNNRHERVGNL